MAVEHVVNLAINSAVDGMDQPVTIAAAGMLQKGGGEDSLAASRAYHVDGIVHAAGHHWFDARPVWPRAKDVRRAGNKRLAGGERVALLSKGSFAPIDPAVPAQIRSVQVVGAAGQRFAFEPFVTLVG